MRVYLYLLLSGLTCNWLYAFIYAYNLAWGGLKNGKNGGEPNGFCLVFVVRRIVFEICGNLRKRAPLSFIVFREIFLLLIPPYLFTVHIRPVLSPCQAGNTCCILSCFFNVYNIINTIYTHNMYIVLCVAPLFLFWDHRILIDVLPI